eukprot:TRINITY_DN453_c0_g1_i4.p1 TRINITY_DN453_c0_g1~~TRINITY_DN453_c0_g1_i4.p1  ORF type:complete len:583 (+),score=129.53 TRINITY_DN453_c0_g1_i4:336-2084(+)
MLGSSSKALQRQQSIRTIKVEDDPEVADDVEVESISVEDKGSQLILRQLMGMLALNKKKKPEKASDKNKKKGDKKKSNISASIKVNTLPSPRKALTAEEKEKKIRDAVSLFAGPQTVITPIIRSDSGTAGGSVGPSSGPPVAGYERGAPVGVPFVLPPHPSSLGPNAPLPSGFKMAKGKPSTTENLLAMFQPPSSGETSNATQQTAQQPTPQTTLSQRQPPKMAPPQPPVLLHQISDIDQPHAVGSLSAPPDTSQPKRGGHSRSQSCGAIEEDDSIDQSDSSSVDESSSSPGVTPSNAVVIKGKSVEVLEQLGKGATATVWKASIDDHIVALKTVSLMGVKDRVALKKVLVAEVEMMKQYRHPNVIRYYGQFYSRKEQEIQIILEYIDGGAISKLLQTVKKFKEDLSAKILFQCLQGLAFLHEHNIIHRDFKPDNMLVSRSTGKIKLIDFGAATKVLEIRTMRRSTVGTPWYTAPEIINGEEYEYSADIWSLGCTVIHFLVGAPPFAELNAVAALFKMAEQTPPTPENITPECKQFLEACLERANKKRPTAAELIKFPFITRHVVGPEDENLLFLFNNPASI